MIRSVVKKAVRAAPEKSWPMLQMVDRAVNRGYWRRVRAWQRFVADSEQWSREELDAYQLRQLQEVLHHAYRHVPYYRRLFDELSARPEDVKQIEDLSAFPTVGKRELQEHLEEFLALNVPPRRREYYTTGGSTGIPVGFYHDRGVTSAKEWAFITSQWRRVDYREGDRCAVLRGTVVSSDEGWELRPLENALVLSAYHLTPEMMPGYLARLREFRPRFIQAYPSAITLLAQFMLHEHEEPLQGLRAILCGSENLYAWQREVLETAFECRIFSWYGQSERVSLAGECEYNQRLHILPQYGVTELLDNENRPIKEPGRRGEIVGTGFLVRAMPLIRYRTMDVGAYARGQCELCGRPYRLMEGIEGRLQEFIVTDTGRLISMTAINMHSPVFDNVQQFRFYQDTAGRVTLRIVPKETFQPTTDERRILSELAPKLGTDIAIVLEFVDDIPRTRHGKHSFLEQKLPIRHGDSYDERS
jgi:phenylacetate-CoA ligase